MELKHHTKALTLLQQIFHFKLSFPIFKTKKKKGKNKIKTVMLEKKMSKIFNSYSHFTCS